MEQLIGKKIVGLRINEDQSVLTFYTDHLRGATKMVPQGWKLVPVEPTLAMIRAGRDTPLAGEADDDSPEDYRGVYRAMLAAAPQPPADHLRGATEMIEKQPSKLSDSEIDAIAEAMPGGLDGFLKGWGWRQFARAVIGAARGEDALDAAPQQPAPAAQGGAEDAARFDFQCPRCGKHTLAEFVPDTPPKPTNPDCRKRLKKAA